MLRPALEVRATRDCLRGKPSLIYIGVENVVLRPEPPQVTPLIASRVSFDHWEARGLRVRCTENGTVLTGIVLPDSALVLVEAIPSRATCRSRPSNAQRASQWTLGREPDDTPPSPGSPGELTGSQSAKPLVSDSTPMGGTRH